MFLEMVRRITKNFRHIHTSSLPAKENAKLSPQPLLIVAYAKDSMSSGTKNCPFSAKIVQK
jgi:hypothetical protein